MISWIRISFVIAAFWASVQTHSVAVAQTGSKDNMEQCTTQMNERAAALVAQDWPQLERLAKRYLQDCKGVFDSENYSTAYEEIAMANLQLNNPAATLVASEKCIDIFYANSGCHVNKVQALIKLKRFAEARTEFGIAERLVGYLIESNEKDLHVASHPVYKKLYSSKDRNLRAQKSLLDRIRPHLF
jgi:hypothetical protein